jgi:hypothetical protein
VHHYVMWKVLSQTAGKGGRSGWSFHRLTVTCSHRLILLVVWDFIALGLSQTCPSGWSGPTTNDLGARLCYKGVTSTKSFDAAITNCNSLYSGATLGTCTSSTDCAVLLTNSCSSSLTGSTTFWIGLGDDPTRISGAVEAHSSKIQGWKWLGSADTAYLFSTAGQALWDSGQPNDNGNCGRMLIGQGLLDAPCTSTYASCCQITLATPSPSLSSSVSPSVSPSCSGSISKSITDTATWTATVTGTTSPTMTPTETSSPSQTVTVTSTVTLSATSTFTPTASTTATATPSATNTLTPTKTVTATSTVSPSRTVTVSTSPTRSVSSTVSSTRSPTLSNTKTSSVTPTATPPPTDWSATLVTSPTTYGITLQASQLTSLQPLYLLLSRNASCAAICSSFITSGGSQGSCTLTVLPECILDAPPTSMTAQLYCAGRAAIPVAAAAVTLPRPSMQLQPAIATFTSEQTVVLINVTQPMGFPSSLNLARAGLPVLPAGYRAWLDDVSIGCDTQYNDTVLGCSFTPSKAIQDTTKLRYRLTVEISGLLNITSDGVPASAAKPAISYPLPSTYIYQAPVVKRVNPTLSTLAEGLQLWVQGDGISDTSAGQMPPDISVGSAACLNISTAAPGGPYLECIAPFVSPLLVGYPRVGITITNAIGLVSQPFMVRYPTTVPLDFAWNASDDGHNKMVYVPASALTGSTIFEVPSTLLTLRVIGPAGLVTCWLEVESHRNGNNTNRIISPAVVGASTQMVDIPVMDIDNLQPVFLTFTGVGVTGSSGMEIMLTASCRDIHSNLVRASAPFTVYVARMQISWADDLLHDSTATTAQPPTYLQRAYTTTRIESSEINLGAYLSNLLCAASILPTGMASSLSVSVWSAVGSQWALNATLVTNALTTSLIPAATVAGNLTLSWPTVSLQLATLAQPLTVLISCLWAPTGEVLQPTLTYDFTTVGALVDFGIEVNTSDVQPYVWYTATIGVTCHGATGSTLPVLECLGGQAPQCSIHTGSISAGQLRTQEAINSVPSAGDSVWRVELYWYLQAAPNADISLQADCILWGTHTVSSSEISFRAAPYTLKMEGHSFSALSSSYGVVFPVAPTPTVASSSQGKLTCTAALDSSTCTLSEVNLVGEASVSTVAATIPVLAFPRLGLQAPSGCDVTLRILCTDGFLRTNSTVPFVIRIRGFAAVWNSSSIAQVHTTALAPLPLPTLDASIAVASLDAINNYTFTASSSYWNCIAMLLPASLTIAASIPLTTMRSQALSTSQGIVQALPNITALPAISLNDTKYDVAWSVSFPGLTAEGCPFGSRAALYGECTWLPTSERHTIKVQNDERGVLVTMVTLAFAWLPEVLMPATIQSGTPDQCRYTATCAALYDSATNGVFVRSDFPFRVPFQLTTDDVTLAVSECRVVMRNASASGTQLIGGDDWVAAAALPRFASNLLSPRLVILALPFTEITLRLECRAYGASVQQLADINIAIMPLHMRVLKAPVTFLPSDTSFTHALSPLQLQVWDNLAAACNTYANSTNSLPIADAACEASAAAVGVPTAGNSVLLQTVSLGDSTSNVGTNGDGVATFPTLSLRGSFDVPSVSLSVRCSRGSVAAIVTTAVPLQLVTLNQVVCQPPQKLGTSQEAVKPFSFAIVTSVTYSSAADRCTSPPLSESLPVACSISLLGITSTSANASLADASQVFLRNNLALLPENVTLVTFPDFTLIAPQGYEYNLLVVCRLGGMVIPGQYTFSMKLIGCAPGTEVQGIFCVKCPSDSFSVGGDSAICSGCPRTGAVCQNGLLQLLPNYYRPPSDAHLPVDASTELHACRSSESCLLNDTTVEYSCNIGYTGPLCAVCDYESNFVQFGENSCRPCWDPVSTWTMLIALLLCAGALLCIVALMRQKTRSSSSIALRIFMSYVQAVGSLRVFKAGGTHAYHDLLGWTAAISASPLSIGPLQCVWQTPFLLQYVMTVALPLTASIAVICIFSAATASQHTTCAACRRCTHCRSTWLQPTQVLQDAVGTQPQSCCCRFDMEGFLSSLRQWWQERRHIAAFVFVLFLAYMPITSSSLRALNCMDTPIGGVTYLTSDLRVTCYQGEHAIAMVLAFIVLAVIGLGFPAILFIVFRKASLADLQSRHFRDAYGFLVEGYKTPPPAAEDMVEVKNEQLGSAPVAGGQKRLRSLPTYSRCSTRRLCSGGFVWWESVVLLRKAGIVLLALLVSNPFLQCVGASLWLLLFFALQLRLQPYQQTQFNVLETWSLASACMTAIISSALLQYDVLSPSFTSQQASEMTPLQWSVTIVMGLINFSTLALLGGVWLSLQVRRAQKRAQGIFERRSVWRRTSRATGAHVSSIPARRITVADAGGMLSILTAAAPQVTTAVLHNERRLSLVAQFAAPKLARALVRDATGSSSQRLVNATQAEQEISSMRTNPLAAAFVREQTTAPMLGGRVFVDAPRLARATVGARRATFMPQSATPL